MVDCFFNVFIFERERRGENRGGVGAERERDRGSEAESPTRGLNSPTMRSSEPKSDA